MGRKRRIEEEVTWGFSQLAKDENCPYPYRVFALTMLAKISKIVDINVEMPFYTRPKKVAPPPVEVEVPEVEDADPAIEKLMAQFKNGGEHGVSAGN